MFEYLIYSAIGFVGTLLALEIGVLDYTVLLQKL